MKQTVEEAAIESCVIDRSIYNDGYQPYYLDGFKDGAEWQSKQSPWISVKERLPEEGQRILVGFLYYYKYADREVESPKHIDIFTYENGWWIDDSDNVYRGKEVTEDDIKVICWQPIPSFDEILEANRDVLERIKQKGD
ncbi:DUF551 domain-containing protein [Phocaeicola dorei]|uniref:DUF551 domain-containing protein n=1 Tax=Phocaeicola dorei TaxID=357276 RepID=UPI0039B48206